MSGLIERIRSDLRYYVEAHRNRHNQILHYFAFLAAFLAWILVFIDLWAALALAVLHYALSWAGHFYFEGNKPAMFRYPLIGFYAGFTWFFLRTYEFIGRKEVIRPFIEK